MPILAVDKLGRIYQTSSDRSDGLGFGSAPECVEQQDVTLGSAYLKAQDRRREDNVQLYRQNQAQDARDRAQAAHDERVRQVQAHKAAVEARMYENPAVVEAATKMAYQQSLKGMGCACDYRTSLSGNAMSANGQSGWAGMSRDQQTLHSAFHGLGSSSNAVDHSESEQMRHKLEAERILRLKARR